ncbi:ATPase activity protein [Halocaridina rubra]|uniref:ATPase activity protein n=1 Tax=Halocaridina rubra TaxID=373956 RepID=A0AAN8WLJ1_HALRR
MVELNLVKCGNTLIGYPGRLKGISGGETKRLAFACEVLTDPPLLFCDEPTTGLDSFMAQNVIEVMRNLSSKGKTIISTIHQPSSEVFAMFDRVLLMAEGRTAFLGSTESALQFFEGMGRICPENYNPADFFVGNLAIQPEKEEECKKFVESVCDAFDGGSIGQEVLESAKDNAKSSMNGSILREDQIKVQKSPYKVSWWSQFKAVLYRAVIENIREVMVLKVKLFQTVLIGLLIGLIYLDQEYDQDGIQNMNGAMFILITQTSFSNVFGVVNTFCNELPIFLREHFNGMYRVDVYYLAKNAAELPLSLCIPVIFISIMYFMVGLNPLAERFFIAMGVLVVLANTVVSFGFMLSCVAKDINVGLGITAPLLVPLMLFGGFFLNANTVPDYFIWIKYISWFNYGNEAFNINQWTGVSDIACNNGTLFCMTTGEEVIERFGYEDGSIGYDIGLLFVLLVAFRLLGFLALLAKTRRKTVKNYE